MGGGDLLSPDSKLEELLLDLAGKARPRVAFLPTAVADSGERTELFLEAFRSRDCEPEVVTLFGLPERSVERVAAADVVYVHGGNTANMLAVWRVHGIDWALREVWRCGRPRRVSPPASCSTPITRSVADRASLIGRLYARADAEWLADRLMDLEGWRNCALAAG